jgi:hypothetical protein
LEYGLCHLATLPIRKENSHASEMTSQLLYGDSYKVLEQQKKWLKIRGSLDQYEGWIARTQFFEIDKDTYTGYQDQADHYSTDLINYVTTQEGVLFPILLGSNLKATALFRHQFDEQAPKQKPQKSDLVQTAFLYLNAPYLWGGKTPFGIDCSGFVQMVYRINGQSLQRDAYQQAEQGQTLSFIEESEPGDLAFFDDKEGKIVHVGMLLENHHIIHAHGKVRIDRVDQSGIFNSELQAHSHKLRMIKKVWP